MRDLTRGARALCCGLGVFACLFGAACDEPKKIATVDAGVREAGSGPVLDGELGAAVAAAEATPAPGGSTKASGDGPPEGGVFAPGQADKAVLKGAPPKIELLGEGDDPKTNLALAMEPGSSQTLAISVAVRQGPQRQLPTLELALAFQIDKAKEGGDEKKPAGGPLHATGKVKKVSPDPAQVASLPKELLDALDKLKGSEIRFTVAPSGGGSDFSYTLAKGADAQLELLLRSAVDALSLLVVPLPSKPVGKGAYWMITDRTGLSGIDVVRYRVARVQSIENGSASLSLETREYAADDRFDLPVGAEGAKITLDQLDSQGKGAVGLGPKAFLPVSGDLSRRMQSRLKAAGQARPMMLQMETQAKLATPSK